MALRLLVIGFAQPVSHEKLSVVGCRMRQRVTNPLG
jgi:hypothetical protein